MRAAFALRIISGKNIYNFAILENLRIFQNCLFTGGVVTESSICSAAFCESAALRETNPLRLTAFASSPKVGAFGSPRKLHLFAKGSPFGRGGFAKQRRRGRGRCPCAPNTIFTGGSLPLFAKKITGSGKAGRLKPKIRTNACFTVLKTYKTAKKFSLFLVRLLGGLRLLCGQNLLL